MVRPAKLFPPIANHEIWYELVVKKETKMFPSIVTTGKLIKITHD